jgi:hypothetical protein
MTAETPEINDEALAAMDRTLYRRTEQGKLYNELYGADEVRALRERLRRAEAANQCDACLGSGKPISSIPCMCGGSGKMSASALYLREQLAVQAGDKFAQDKRIEKLLHALRYSFEAFEPVVRFRQFSQGGEQNGNHGHCEEAVRIMRNVIITKGT